MRAFLPFLCLQHRKFQMGHTGASAAGVLCPHRGKVNCPAFRSGPEARAGKPSRAGPTCFLDAVCRGVQRFWGIIQKIVRTAMKHLVIFLLLLVPVLASCSGERDGKGGRQAAPVHVMTVQPQDVPRVLGAVGNVRASASVGSPPA